MVHLQNPLDTSHVITQRKYFGGNRNIKTRTALPWLIDFHLTKNVKTSMEITLWKNKNKILLDIISCSTHLFFDPKIFGPLIFLISNILWAQIFHEHQIFGPQRTFDDTAVTRFLRIFYQQEVKALHRGTFSLDLVYLDYYLILLRFQILLNLTTKITEIMDWYY